MEARDRLVEILGADLTSKLLTPPHKDGMVACSSTMSYLCKCSDFDESPKAVRWTCPRMFWILTSL